MLPTKTQDRETEKWEEKKKKKKTQNLGLVSILAKGPMVLLFSLKSFQSSSGYNPCHVKPFMPSLSSLLSYFSLTHTL